MSIDTSSSLQSLSPRLRLGDYLIHQNAINESELEVALCEQSRQPRLLGEILLKLGFIKPDVFYPLLADFLGYPYVDLTKCLIETDCLKLLPTEKGLRLGALIFQKTGKLPPCGAGRS